MFKKLLLVAAIFVMGTQTAFAWDLGGVISAGKDVVKAATLTDEEVKSIARDAKKEMDSLNKLATSKDQYGERLARIVKGMKTEEGLDLDIKVYLVKDVNAFAMADGTIRVFAGLMKEMSDDEIRYVIGHEIGHVKLGHSKGALQTAYTTSAARKGAAASGKSAVVALSKSQLGELAEKLTHAQYSQANELEADKYALNFMKQNKYNSKAAVSALRKLQTMFGNDKSMFSSHPAPGDRADALEKMI